MDKKSYTTPEMEITGFDTEDIITTSGLQTDVDTGTDSEGNPFGKFH